MNVLFVLLVSAVFGGVVYAVLDAQVRRRQFRERLAQVVRPAESVLSGEDAPTRLDRPVEAWLRRALSRAGLRLGPAEFALLWAACPLGLGALGGTVTRLPLMGLLLALIGGCVPLLVLRAGEAARRRRFDGQLPDALGLIVSALRSGYSLARSAQAVTEEMPAPVAEEFSVALAEMGLGLPLATALARMAARAGSMDLDLVVTAVATQQQTGGDLAEILARIADTIRERVRVQGEINALTAEGKLSGLILVLLPPTVAVLLTLRDPAYFQPLLRSPVGHVMIAGAVMGQIAGAVIIKRMVTLDL